LRDCTYWWWQLKHIKQLVEYYRNGYKNRYPNEHLAGDSDEEFSSPLYATAVGLVMNSIDNQAGALEKRNSFAKSSCISAC
jgi:cell division protein FtsA